MQSRDAALPGAGPGTHPSFWAAPSPRVTQGGPGQLLGPWGARGEQLCWTLLAHPAGLLDTGELCFVILSKFIATLVQSLNGLAWQGC